MANNIFGIDLGTNNIKIYKRADDSIFVEKNMIAIENKKNYFAYGDSAFEMYEKAPGNIVASYPVSNGVIADIKNMESLLKYFINDLSDGNLKQADFYVAVPTDVTEVEKRAFYDLIKDANIKAKKIMVVEKAVADGYVLKEETYEYTLKDVDHLLTGTDELTANDKSSLKTVLNGTLFDQRDMKFITSILASDRICVKAGIRA